MLTRFRGSQRPGQMLLTSLSENRWKAEHVDQISRQSTAGANIVN